VTTTIKQRIAVAFLSFSAAAFIGLATKEGYTDKAVIPTKNDRPTVGFGSTFDEQGRPVKMGDTITPVQAVQRSLAHIQKDETALKKCVTAPLHQVEYNTMVDFSYQYGSDTLCKSSVVRLANAGDYAGSCRAYLQYRYSGGFDCSIPGNKVCAGVWGRSQDRYNTCMGEQK
jgi:lysozyme